MFYSFLLMKCFWINLFNFIQIYYRKKELFLTQYAIKKTIPTLIGDVYFC